MFRNLRAVFFDLDGTLVDSAPDLGAAVDRMRVSRGLASLPFERYRTVAGAGARGLLGEAFGLTPDHPDFSAMREEFFQNYDACLTDLTRPFEGVAEMLASLEQSGLPWGIVTNKSSRFALPLTRGLSAFAGVKTIVCGDTTAHAKPHPEPLLEAARRLGVSPSDCLYVGDDQRDIVAGLAAGMKTVAALYGYIGAAADVSTWGAHAEIKSPHELLQLIGNA